MNGTMVAVADGVVVDREGGWVRRRVRYAAGVPDGEALRFGEPGEPLFSLDPALLPALEGGTLAPLRPALERHGLTVTDGAQILVDDPGVEWRIAQPDPEGMLTVRREGGGLPVRPGRVVQRTVYARGEVVQLATYVAGRLHGRLTVCRPPESGALPLFVLPGAARGALDRGDAAALVTAFRDGGHDLRAGASVTVVHEQREWFVDQAGQTFSVRQAEGAASGPGVYPGRVASRAAFREGRLDGQTALYDERGGLLQTLSFRRGRLDGPLIVYRDGRPQTAGAYREGRLHGEQVTYDDLGRPATVATYDEGQQSGPLRLLQGGEPQVVAPYLDGHPHGETVVYQPNGRELLVAPYVAGQLEGERRLYAEDGHPLQRAEYAGGALYGRTVDYYPSGQVRQVAGYRRDRLDGPLYVYDPQGRLTEERLYQDGTLVQQHQRGSWLGRLRGG